MKVQHALDSRHRSKYEPSRGSLFTPRHNRLERLRKMPTSHHYVANRTAQRSSSKAVPGTLPSTFEKRLALKTFKPHKHRSRLSPQLGDTPDFEGHQLDKGFSLNAPKLATASFGNQSLALEKKVRRRKFRRMGHEIQTKSQETIILVKGDDDLAKATKLNSVLSRRLAVSRESEWPSSGL